MPDHSLFATPPSPFPTFFDCLFYHVMDVPGHGLTGGQWDLRSTVDEYLGHVPFRNQRVLEIGPASGFFTFEMEKRGADVVSVEVTEQHGWDFVPFPPSVMDPIYEPRRKTMEQLRNSYWYAHRAHGSKARVHYGDVYQIPSELGEFDVAVMGAVLLHTRNPLRIVEQCAKRAKQIIITDMFHPPLEGNPVCKLLPTRENHIWDTWWAFSTDLFKQFLGVLEFTDIKVITHTQYYKQTDPCAFFTLVASK